ncbi:MAG: ATP12 family chaperone protein [Rhizobiaceae bacterium]
MREILNDLDAQRFVSDPDPVRRTRNQMRQALPKRFYTRVEAVRTEEGYQVRLDDKPVRTPGRQVLVLPTEQAARLVAEEFEAQAEFIDPVAMPLTRLINTAIDGVASDPQAVIEDIMRFAASDLVCYRAEGPDGLVSRQADQWDPVLDWVRATLGARFLLAEGVIHVDQPREAVGGIGLHLRQREDPLRLTAMHLMTTLTGSALLALAAEAGALTAEAAWTAANVDEDWQAEQWGRDSEAVARDAARRRDFMAAAQLIAAIGR